MNGGSPIPDEKRTLIDTDASHRRFTLMIFIRVNPCSSVSDYLRSLFSEQAPRATARRYR